jgi:thymidylate synthase
MMTVNDIRTLFVEEYNNKNFVQDRSGQNMIEVLGASFIADEPAIFGTPNEEYIKAELDWYESESTNINDIYGDGREPPAAWKATANLHGEINSNYGYLVFSDKFNNQFAQVVNELTENSSSRRASMIYTRPSIWVDYSDNGKNDFICTNAVTYYIRDSQLHCVVQMRSNDVWAGYRNDYAWQLHLLKSVCDRYLDLNMFADLKPGNIYWQVQNLHMYERNFYMLDHFIKTAEFNITKKDYDILYNI